MPEVSGLLSQASSCLRGLKCPARHRMEVLKTCAGWEMPRVFRLFIVLPCFDHRSASICLNRVHIWCPLGSAPERGGDYRKEWLEIMGKRGFLISNRRGSGPEHSWSGWGLAHQPQQSSRWCTEAAVWPLGAAQAAG